MGSYGQDLAREMITRIIGRAPLVDVRPDWLNGLELDLYWPDLGFAVEFQGDQHYLPIAGLPELKAQQRRDRAKRQICREAGVRLVNLDACDLQPQKLVCKMRCILRSMGHKRKRGSLRPLRAGSSDARTLRALGKKAKQYRHLLIEKYGSASARKRGSDARKIQRYEWLIANGYSAKPPVLRAEKLDRKTRCKEQLEARLRHLRDNQPDDGVHVTKEVIELLFTPAGGVTQATVEALGFEWGVKFGKVCRGLLGLLIDREMLERAVMAAHRPRPSFPPCNVTTETH